MFCREVPRMFQLDTRLRALPNRFEFTFFVLSEVVDRITKTGEAPPLV